MSRSALLAFTASFLLATAALHAAQNHTLVVPPASVPAPTFATAQSPNSETFAGWHFAPGGLAGAFRYQAGEIRRLPHTTGIGQHALGIRGNGEVTGYQDFPVAGGGIAQRAFRSTAALGTVDLGTLGGDNSWAASASGSGPLIAGSSQRSDGLFRAFRILSLGAPMQELPGLGGPEAGANGCNDLLVVGWAENALGEKRAVVWDAAGSIAELPTLGGTQAEAIFVQANGLACGWSETASGDIHACLWDLNAGSAAVDLGTLGGSESRALSMNAAGEVVGSAQRTDGSFAAFLWDATDGMQDLQDRLLPSSPWQLESATGISERGTICGSAFRSLGQQHLFQLRPLLLELNGGQAGTLLQLQVSGAGSKAALSLIQGRTPGAFPVAGCPGLELDAIDPSVLAAFRADAEGRASLQGNVPIGAAGLTFLYQLVDGSSCVVSPAIWFTH